MGSLKNFFGLRNFFFEFPDFVVFALNASFHIVFEGLNPGLAINLVWFHEEMKIKEGYLRFGKEGRPSYIHISNAGDRFENIRKILAI